MFAALQGRTAVVEMLIEKRSPTRIRDKFGDTPLMLAVMSRNLSVVSFLLVEGDIDAQDESGMTALMWAVSSGLDDIAMLI